MFCSKCGQEVKRDNAKFCENCGADVKSGLEGSSNAVNSISLKSFNISSETLSELDFKTIIPNLVVLLFFFIPVYRIKGSYGFFADIVHSKLGFSPRLSISSLARAFTKIGSMEDIGFFKLSPLLYLIPILAIAVMYTSYIKHSKTDILNLCGSVFTSFMVFMLLFMTWIEPVKDYIGIKLSFLIFFGASLYSLKEMLEGKYKNIAVVIVSCMLVGWIFLGAYIASNA